MARERALAKDYTRRMTGPITLMTVGSRGDVQPFVALALELLRRGYGVRLAAPAEARPLVEELGVPFFPLEAHYTGLAQSERGQAAIAGHWREVASLLAEVREQTRALLDSAQRAAQGSGALVFHPKALAGRHLAEALGVPAWLMLPAPLLLPTREFAAPATVAEARAASPPTQRRSTGTGPERRDVLAHRAAGAYPGHAVGAGVWRGGGGGPHPIGPVPVNEWTQLLVPLGKSLCK